MASDSDKTAPKKHVNQRAEDLFWKFLPREKPFQVAGWVLTTNLGA